MISSNLCAESVTKLSKIKNLCLITKPNRGYDFGSWSVGVNAFPPGEGTEEILFLNDSGVITNLNFEQTLQKLSASSTSATFLTDSNLPVYHGQSYLMHFKGSLPKNSNFIQFWANVPELDGKPEVIDQLEIATTKLIYALDEKVSAIFPWNIFSDPNRNPCVNDWEILLGSGLPLVKREVLRNFSSEDIKNINSTLKSLYSDAAYEITLQDIY